jgi:uncharacterized protein (DUF433 family)
MTTPIVQLGTGAYTVNDAAKLLDIPTGRVSTWIRKYWENIFTDQGTYTTEPGHKRLFNFYTLMEIIAVQNLREEKISMHKITQAHKILGEVYNTQYPFALKKFMLFGNEILHFLNEETALHLDEKKQIAIREFFEPYCKNIDFNEDTDLAEKYYPYGKDFKIVLDPNHQLGRPVITGTNIFPETVASLYNAGEDPEWIAKSYQLDLDAVTDAIKYYRMSA